MHFTDAVTINPSVRLKKGEMYPFVEMAALNPGTRSVCESDRRSFSGSGARFRRGDTLMARITPCLENGKIARYLPSDDYDVGFGSTEFIVIRGEPGVTTDDFAYYLAQWEEFRHFAIGQMVGTSGRQRVPADALSGFDVNVPPLRVQKGIAAILGRLDDKIELNRRMSETLEKMAAALFKSWFVDFDPVHAKAEGRDTGLPDELAALFPSEFEGSELGPIPKGCEVKSLDQIATYLNGVACQKYPPTESAPSLPVIKIKELNDGITPATSRASTKIQPKFIVDDGDVLFSWSGTLLVDVWRGGRGVLNQHLFKVSSEKYPAWFVYYTTKHFLGRFQQIAAGKATTMGHIKRQHLTDAKLALPAGEMVSGCAGTVTRLFTLRTDALVQARKLAQLRDTLLPKLLSGEIEVPEAEAQAEEAAV
ncbi:MAG: restriction endonuclease subunit S [Sinobacteraceae bacterium]|nr:restriction endonuclease subunit S [Nevskiaceae bacterium]